MGTETAMAAVREKTISAVERGITKATHTTIHATNEGTDSCMNGLLGEVPPFSTLLPDGVMVRMSTLSSALAAWHR